MTESRETEKPGRWRVAVGVAMVMPFLGALLYWVVLGDAAVVSRYTYAGIKIFALCWPVIAWAVLLRRSLPWHRVTDWRAHLRGLPLGLLTGLVISAGIIGFRYLPAIRSTVDAGAAGIVEKTVQLGILEHYWAFAIFLSIFHSLLEEYYWRGFVYGTLRERLPRWSANLLAAAAFSSHHYIILWAFFEPWLAIVTGTGVFLGGVIWAAQYERQQSLAGVWLSHAIVDLAIMWLGWGILTQP